MPIFTAKVKWTATIVATNTLEHFLSYETEFFLFSAVLENSVLPMGLDSSNETLEVTLVVYKRYLRAVTKNFE